MMRTKFENLTEMSRIGMIGRYEVYVNTDDPGEIPHFHYRVHRNWDEFHTCIEIQRPRYFHHEGKEGVLNSHQRRDLQKFMESSPDPDISSDPTNWEFLVRQWNANNSSRKVDLTKVDMPDYRLLPS